MFSLKSLVIAAAIVTGTGAAGSVQAQTAGFGHTNWLVSDWGCDGSSDSTTALQFHRDGTFADDQGGTGVWSLNGRNVVLTYDVGTAYTGVTHRDVMKRASGTMVSDTGETGCWVIWTPV